MGRLSGPRASRVCEGTVWPPRHTVNYIDSNIPADLFVKLTLPRMREAKNGKAPERGGPLSGAPANGVYAASSGGAGCCGWAWYSKNTMVPLTITEPSSPMLTLTLSSIQRYLLSWSCWSTALADS